MIIMNTDNSDHVVAIGNLVMKFLIPVVLIMSCLAGMCYVTIHMATPEVKPKEHFYWKQNTEKFISVGS